MQPQAPPPEFEYLPTQLGYDRWAEIYDDEQNPLVALEEQPLRELLGDVRGLDVADLGCGTGRHALDLARRGARVTAVDFSQGMLERARAKAAAAGLEIGIAVADLTAPLPLADAAFDRVVCGLVIDHIGDLAAFFREAGRICRPDGRIVASTLHPAMMLRGVQARFTDPVTGRLVRPASFPHQISDYVLGIVRAGLHIEHMSEHAVGAELAARFERAAKYLGWPVLLLFGMSRTEAQVSSCEFRVSS